ncbi:MAG TPA: alpha/beta fold hydrolase [Gemmatimonadota bacterium]|nr:alpha/beta fold hydrolase [Gemmatimonadota bacterium]
MVSRIGILVLLSIAGPRALWAQVPEDAGLAGTWTGAWGRAADTLAVTMRFEEQDGAWIGSFDAERLRVEGIPFQEVEVELPEVIVRLVGDATTTVFIGRVERDSLTGILREGEDLGWFALVRTTAPAPSLSEEEVRFRNGEVELAGTLVLPPGSGPHPAVVFLHGSGAEGRWASRFLARRLAHDGIAALIWDKRGVGGSAGWWPEASFEDLAADAAAAVAFVRTRPEVDPARVGIHGHSQGGTIAPLAAVRSGADFVIASAAAGLPMADVEVYSVGNAIGLASLPPEEAALARAFVEVLVDVAYRGAPAAELEAVAERARGHAWFFDPPGPDDPYWLFSRRIADFDPLGWWAQIEVPVLLLYGSGDERVPVEPSRMAIVGAIEALGKAQVETRVFEGADHTFRVRRPGDVWPRTVDGYPEALLDWLRDGFLAGAGL